MRPISVNAPLDDSDAAFRRWTREAIEEIERASHESDPGELADAYSSTAAFTPTRELITSAPTLANTNLVLATLLEDMRKRGVKHE